MRLITRSPSRLALVAGVLAAMSLYAYAFARETPFGALRGRVLAADTQRPLAGAELLIRSEIPRDGRSLWPVRADEEGFFEIRRLPAGGYDVQTATSVYQSRHQFAEVLEGKTTAVELRLPPGDPFLNLHVHQRAYLPEEEPRMALHGFRQGDALRLRLLAVDSATLVRDYGSDLRSMLTPVAATVPQGSLRVQRSRHLLPVREWTYSIRKKDAEGVFYEHVRLGRLRPGLYLIAARGATNEALGWLMVTDLALVTKTDDGRLLAFATDLRTGKPVPSARLTVYRGATTVAQTSTDARGLADISLGTDSNEDDIAAVAQHGSSVAFMRFYHYDAGARQRYRVCLYTDRPVYRPGHRVRFKGVVRRLETSGYAVPSSPTVLAEVRDEQETVFYRDESALNERGSFAGEFTLPVEARSGYYTLSVRVDGEEHADGFVVASYRKPEWQVVVSTPKRCYVRGERVPVTVHAEYYYGAPVVNAQASYTIYRSPSWSWWDEDQESDFEENEEYSGGYGDVVETGEVTTDQSGNAQFEFGTDLPRDEDRFADYEYNIEIEVTDLSNRSAYGNGSVLVRAGELTLDVRPSRFIAAPGETVPVLARARDLADKPAAGVTLTATAVLLVWDRGREQERPLASQTAQTDARGLARLQMPMEGPGLVLIRLSATDRRGNRIETSTDIWISTAEGGDYARTYPQLSVLLDRKRYRIGDTAQVLVNTDRPGATALLTVEAEGILDVRLVPLRRKSTVVRLPIRAGYEPNVFVTACFVRNREFVSSQARLNVNADAHRLQVTIESDRQVYRPGEAATFQVHTRDVRGRSVSAEFSFGLVDEAIYAIQEGATDSLWQAFYPRRRNAVQTEFSYPEVYLGDASKDGAEVNVRKQFPDTAYWNPFLVTDAAGQATVQIRLPDSLTSWRATVLAHSPQTEVGEARHNIRVMKDLTVRLQAPRSLTEGDRLTLSAVVHNYSARPLDVSVELRAAGLEVQGAAGRRVSLKPDQAEKVHWEAVVGGAGTATLTAIATAGALSDGMQLTAPVRAFARQKIDYRTGVVSGEVAREEFPLDPAAADGSLELRLSPTLAGTLLGSLEYLVHYPYGCTEQTMSSFLPNVVVLQTLRSLGLRRPELEQRVPAMAQAGLVRLYGFQHADGGWGWWEYDKSDPWMTAYVLFGLTVARAAGIEVNRQVYRNGLQAAVQLARGKELSPDNAMFLAYVLTRTPAARRARVLLQRLEEEKPKLHIRSLGYAALALAAIPSGSGQNRRQAKALMEELWRRADHSGGLIRWAETRSARDYGVPPDVESTAVVLKAALALTPRDPRLAGVVRWLLLERHGNRWESTRDTAWILFTLADYLKATGELRPDYRLTVLLNDREIHSKEVRPGDALQEETVLRVPLRPDAVGMAPANRLEVRKSGRGSAYYALEMRQEIRAPRFAAESSSSGLSLQRDYFRLETRRDAAGRPVVVPTEKPGSSVRVGDRILVRLRLHTDRPLEYLILEDPIPAGFEVQERGEVERHEWNYWWSHMDVRDDRVALFVRDVTPGEHTVEYYVRPEVVGTIRVLPAVLSDMYAPATRAATSDSRLEVAK